MSTRRVGNQTAAPSELDAARARIAELEARDAEHEHAAKVQAALYRIAETASAAEDMPSFYATIHEIVGELMYAENFYIALYDADRQTINYPYYVDSIDTDLPDPAVWEPFGVGQAVGATAYALRLGKPALIPPEEHERLIADGELQALGVMTSENTWMGAPLRSAGGVIGLLVVQTYTTEHAYSHADLELLDFVARHVGSALARARALDETRRRNNELSLINEIGSALAQQLDFNAIIDLVGARLISIFNAPTGFIALLDSSGEKLTYPYFIGPEGQKLDVGELPLGSNLASELITSQRSLRLNTLDELNAHSPAHGDERPSQSFLGVPIRAGERVIGAISVQAWEPHAFSEADERLMETLASSMGVALENARLFDETKRLLTETDERAAELAVVNSVQQGLAQNLDMQSMYELVGDKIQEIFDAQVVDIGIFDIEANLINFPYAIERGVRYPDEPVAIGGYSKELITRGAPIHIPDIPAWNRETGEDLQPIQGEPAHSLVAAPLFSGGAVRGRISLQNLDRTHAFTDADVRLLSTLAGSLSVALENARLFDETKRLLAETDERAA